MQYVIYAYYDKNMNNSCALNGLFTLKMYDRLSQLTYKNIFDLMIMNILYSTLEAQPAIIEILSFDNGRIIATHIAKTFRTFE